MSGGDLINAAINTEELEVSAAVTTEEPEVAATLSDLRFLVFQGKKGDTGDSAYEEAVALGFVGTEAEWLASLKGDPGADAEGAVRYDEAQSLTAAQKDQARSNIGAGKTYEAQYGTDSADMLIATIVGHTVVWCKHDGKVFFARTYSSSGHVVYFVCPGVSTYFLKVQGTTWSTETYTPFSLPTNGQRGQALLSDGSGGAEWGEGGGAAEDAVLYTAQSLTDSQKAQARTNVGAGTYSKPSGGIPASDLASAVQTSLGKADTALQTAPVTSVNNKTGAVTLTASDVGALPSSTSIPTKVSDLTNDSNFQTAAQVQSAIAAIPDELPSVTASDNGKSLVAANGAWAKGYQAVRIPRVAMTSSDTTPTLNPNTFYVFPTMASLAPTLNAPSDNSIVNEYHFIFTSGATATTLTLPAAVLQPDGFTVEANHVYEVSILENCMTAQGWAVTA